jgi:hypothetical protein
MTRTLPGIRSVLFPAPLLLGLLTVVPAAVGGDVTLATEAMLEDQSALVGLLAYNFGPDPSSPLIFTSNVDASTSAFSYKSTSASPTYLGQSVSIVGSGTLDSSGNYMLSGSIMLGSTSYTTTGTVAVSTLADGSTQFVEDVNILAFPPANANDVHIVSVWLFGKSVDFGWFTLNKVKIAGSDFVSTDRLLPNGDEEYDLLPIFPPPTKTPMIVTTGNQPPTGGMGSFTSTTFAAVPEPASITMAALGGLITCGYVASRRRGRAARGTLKG